MCLSRDLLIVICLSDSPVSTLACVLADSVFGSPLGLTFQYSDLGCPCDYDFCLVPIKPCFFTFTVLLGHPLFHLTLSHVTEDLRRCSLKSVKLDSQSDKLNIPYNLNWADKGLHFYKISIGLIEYSGA